MTDAFQPNQPGFPILVWYRPQFAQPDEIGPRLVLVQADSFESAVALFGTGQLVLGRDLKLEPHPDRPGEVVATASRPMALHIDAILRLARTDFQPIPIPAPDAPAD